MTCISTCLALSVWAVFAIFNHAPALNPGLRVAGIFDDWRIEPARALYDEPAYLHQIGQGFLNGDILVSEQTGAVDELADPETALEWARSAQAALEKSVQLAPADTYNWAALAWANALAGDIDEAREAMLVSRRNAPHTLSLSYSRLAFDGLIAGDGGMHTEPLKEAEVKAVLTDLSVLRHFDPRSAASIENAPELQPLIPNEN
jgi:hypothetical protein